MPNPLQQRVDSAVDWAKDNWTHLLEIGHFTATMPGAIHEAHRTIAQAHERAADHIDRIRDGGTQGPTLHDHARHIRAESLHAHAANDAAKVLDHSAAGNGTLNKSDRARLARDAKQLHASAAAHDIEAGPLTKASNVLKTPVADVVRMPNAAEHAVDSIAHLAPRAVRGIPLLGVVASGAAVADDVTNRHVNPGVAVAANGAALVAGEVAVTGVVVAGAALTAPAWAVALGGVAVGAAASWAVSAGVEYVADRIHHE